MVTLLLDRPFSEQQLASANELDLRNIGVKVWPTLVSKCQAKDLRLYHLTLISLAGIEALQSARRLALEWANKIVDLKPVFRLVHLASLSIYDFPKLRELDGIEGLSDLTELNLSGNRGAISPPLRLASIEPVSRISALTKFSLLNAKLDDDDITCLARCSRLRHLQLSNQFERGQVAFLAKRLNPQLAEPLAAYFDTDLACEQCHGKKSMFVGRRMPVLCSACDKSRFERHIDEFEQLVQSA